MAVTNDSMMTPQLEVLLGKVDSKFSLVTLAASRARELQQYYAKMGSVSSKVVPPQVASLRKPLSMGFEEIAADKIVRVSADEMAERRAAEEAAQADAAALFASSQEAISDDVIETVVVEAVVEASAVDAESGDA
ncbi:MAG: DNA-directed RNA polymerase subunit omega [Ilumatobacteraceae bacterium]|jgi:DNA-directed RNA polymerase subunit omega|nr:DNA-directed RNA polymerase subunit omega [Ilumatobacteraceae bacterium]MDP4937315.1 DNA-directed RNA polymerase subunit omega [Ilumatobacteraceae bacterium]MDP5115672.1 DNA-directed RNA polymerase subunit omega [Ilumatobacteraceae bacterium]